jgi:hypothetical protein
MATTPTTPAPSDPRNTAIASGKRAVQITATPVQPPSPLYLQPEDSLIWTIFAPTSALPQTFFLFIRWLRPDGEIVSVKKTLTVIASGGFFPFTLGEGFLLSATCVNSTLIVNEPNRYFSTLVIQRDTPESGSNHWQLFSDSITGSHFPTWPYGRNIMSHDAAPRLRSITGTTPGAGLELLESVPSNARWRFLYATAILTTSATVANRFPTILLDDGINLFYRWNSGAAIPASAAIRIVFAPVNLAGASDLSINTIFIPDNLFMSQGYRFRTVTTALQAGDQWSSLQYLVQEWIDQ